MPAPPPIIPISYLNSSGEPVPPYAVVELYTDVDTTAIGVISVKARKPTGVGPYAIDLGGGAASSGAGAYGQCVIPLSHVTWVKFNGSPPATPWLDRIGPVIGQWYMDTTGTGYWFSGAYSSGDGRLLVNQINGGSSGVILGRATSAIGAATSPLAPTAFTFVEFLTDDASVTPHTQVEDTVDKDGVNEWPVGAGVDSIIALSFTKGEWHLLNFVERCPDV